ncbi:MAG: hypothetical protein RI922_2324, partial [Bacteroidota bacterium]
RFDFVSYHLLFVKRQTTLVMTINELKKKQKILLQLTGIESYTPFHGT